ncbi:MAG: ABC transporter ATP-binding protein [Candidatus Marinimicrobia bacterium]|nr:ABC transporter ATP-binding protein [Candidatus Neomarinimicrobiota bacterium]
MIEFKNVNLKYSETPIFKQLNFKIEQGERVCFSGPSGRGKSTLLKMMQGYALPDDGEILINGWQLGPHRIKQIRDLIIWVPQNINLPVNTGVELLDLMALSSKLSRVQEIASDLLLEADIIKKDFSKISGGQKQRLIISVCLSLDKPIILMDEPTSSLDFESIEALVRLLTSLKNKTLISASHNEQWLNASGRVVKL